MPKRKNRLEEKESPMQCHRKLDNATENQDQLKTEVVIPLIYYIETRFIRLRTHELKESELNCARM